MYTRFLFCICIFIFLGCEDKTQVVPNTNPFEVIPQNFKQNCLLENFCSEANGSCVANSFYLDTLLQQYKSHLVVCNFHTNDWLESPTSNQLSSTLGGLVGVPRAAINREPALNTVNSEDGVVIYSPINWLTNLTRIYKKQATCVLSIETGFETSEKGFATIYIAHKEAIVKETKLVVYAVEDNIPQFNQQNATPNFVHNHVFKKILTNNEGELVNLSNSSTAGEIIPITISAIELNNYNLANLYLIAFLYQPNADYRKLNVLNVQQVKFGAVKTWD